MPCPKLSPIFSTAEKEVLKTNTLAGYIRNRDKTGAMKYVHYKPAKLKTPPNGKWYIEFSFKHPVTGKFVRIKKYGIDDGGGLNRIEDIDERKRVGREWADGYNIAFKEGWVPKELQSLTIEPIKSWNLFQALNLWKLNTENKTERPKTVSSYGIVVNYFLRKFSNLKISLDEITSHQIENFLISLKKSEGWANTTYNNYLRFTKTFFNFCVDQGLCEKSPATRIKKLQATVSKHKTFSDKEFEKIKKHASPELLRFCEFLYETGLRPKEAREMKYKYVQGENLFVPGKISKNKKDEFVPLSKSFVEKLQGEPEDFIFGGKKMIGTNYFGSQFSELKKLLQLDSKHSLYSLKHTRAIHLTRDKVDPYAIMKLFRHSSLEITMNYLRELGLEDNREAVDKGRSF